MEEAARVFDEVAWTDCECGETKLVVILRRETWLHCTSMVS